MRPINLIVRAIAVSATLAAAMPGVAFAGQNDRAQMAIAEARGKISAGNMVGAAVDANNLQMRAKATLNDAEALLSKGKKTEAIAAAQQASLLADQAIAMTNDSKAAAADNAVANAEASAASAQQAAAASAQNAAEANARADVAIASQPAPSTTTTVSTTEAVQKPVKQTVTTVTAQNAPRKSTVRVTKKRVAVKPATVTQSTTTTTTVPQ